MPDQQVSGSRFRKPLTLMDVFSFRNPSFSEAVWYFGGGGLPVPFVTTMAIVWPTFWEIFGDIY